jgi:hypothetical protein
MSAATIATFIPHTLSLRLIRNTLFVNRVGFAPTFISPFIRYSNGNGIQT